MAVASVTSGKRDPVAGAAKSAAVLRPGGRLAVFWNAFGFPPALREAEWLDVVPTFGGQSQLPAPVLGEVLAGPTPPWR